MIASTSPMPDQSSTAITPKSPATQVATAKRRGTRSRRASRGTQAVSKSSEPLSRYMSEMSRLRVFTREEELVAATNVAVAELAFWTQLLSYPPAFLAIARGIEAAVANGELDVDPGELSPLRGLVQENSPTEAVASADEWGQAAEQLAQTLRAKDSRRLVLRSVFELVKRWCRDELSGSPDGAAEVDAYHRRVMSAHRRQSQAKQRFSGANLRLVLAIARRYNRGRLPLADLIQEGNLGLMTAVERFDPSRGFRFSTYAAWWIRHAIHRSIADKSRTVRVPVHRQDLSQRVARLNRKSLAQNGRLATISELAKETGESERKLQDLRDQPDFQSWSLNREVGDEDGRSFLDLLVDDTAKGSDEVAADKEWEQQLRELMTELKPIEARILRARFGLEGCDELTLRDLGLEFGLSRERVRQLQERALTQLRHRMRAMASPSVAN